MHNIRERNGRWQSIVRFKHQGVIVFQESQTFASKKQAELWGLTLESKIEQEGGWQARQQGRVTVAQLLDTHIAYLTKLKKPTLAYAGRVKNIKAHKLGAMAVGKVTSSDIVAWASDFSVGRAPATVLNHLMALSAAFRSGPLAHRINTDVRVVAQAISYLKQHGVAQTSTCRDRRVTDKEIDAIADRHESLFDVKIPLRDIMRLLVALPRRRSEILRIEWKDYDEKANTLALWDTKHPTKVRHEVIPVPVPAQKLLAKLPRTDERIMPYKAGSVTDAFSRAVAALGLGDLHLHDLRHEGISRLFDLGLDIPDVALISGHLSWGTLKRYTHIKPKTVLDKLNAYKPQT